MGFCAQCGSANAEGARFCEKCGQPVAASAPVAPGAKPEAPAAMAKAAAAGAVSAARRLNPLLLAGIGVVALAVVAGVVVLRPMDRSDYRREAQDLGEDLRRGVTRIDSAVYDMAYDYEDEDDELDQSAVEDAREDFKKEAAKIKDAAKGIERLRPPSDYKDADEDLRLWAGFYSNEWLKSVDDALAQAERGMTYEEFSDLLNDIYEDQSDAIDDAYDALLDADGELRLNLSEGE